MSVRPETTAEAVWHAILPEIRATRRRRRARRLALGGAAVILLVWALVPRPGPAASPATVVRTAPAIGHFAVYRVADNGTVRLEMVAPDELGATELPFGLTPVVITDPQGEW